MDTKMMWFTLSKVPGLTAERIQKLIECFGDIKELFQSKKESVGKAAEQLRIPASVMDAFFHMSLSDLVNEYKENERAGIHFICCDETDFPKQMQLPRNSPFFLYYTGVLPSKEIPSLSIVGARNCSTYGKEIALCFSKLLANCGVQIISGLARGIDGYAHQGSLIGGGYTCGVLGFGIDVCYPKEHYHLKEEIMKQGCLVSEYPPGTPGYASNFPARNRIIAGFSDAVLVIEAAQRSGTLITVEFAVEQNKSIFAIPGRIGDSLSEGCNELIKDGAIMVTNPEDILLAFRLHLDNPTKSKEIQKNKIALETEDEIVYACLDLYPKHVDQLLIRTGLSQNILNRVLLKLELLNYIGQPIPNYYIRKYS